MTSKTEFQMLQMIVYQNLAIISMLAILGNKNKVIQEIYQEFNKKYNEWEQE